MTQERTFHVSQLIPIGPITSDKEARWLSIVGALLYLLVTLWYWPSNFYTSVVNSKPENLEVIIVASLIMLGIFLVAFVGMAFRYRAAAIFAAVCAAIQTAGLFWGFTFIDALSAIFSWYIVLLLVPSAFLRKAQLVKPGFARTPLGMTIYVTNLLMFIAFIGGFLALGGYFAARVSSGVNGGWFVPIVIALGCVWVAAAALFALLALVLQSGRGIQHPFTPVIGTFLVLLAVTWLIGWFGNLVHLLSLESWATIWNRFSEVLPGPAQSLPALVKGLANIVAFLVFFPLIGVLIGMGGIELMRNKLPWTSGHEPAH
jgi:hypothetical protein